MKDRIGVRLLVAAGVVALGGGVILWALAIGFSPRHVGAAAPHGYELGQFLAFAEDGIPTPIGIYRESLRGLPVWLQPPVARLLHVEFCRSTRRWPALPSTGRSAADRACPGAATMIRRVDCETRGGVSPPGTERPREPPRSA